MAGKPDGFKRIEASQDEMARLYREVVKRMRERIAAYADVATARVAGLNPTITEIQGAWASMKSDLRRTLGERSAMFMRQADELFRASAFEAVAQVNRLYADGKIAEFGAELEPYLATMRANPINGGSLQEIMEDADARTMTRLRSAFMASAAAPDATFSTIMSTVRGALGTDLTGMLRVVDRVGERVLNEAIDVGLKWSADRWVKAIVGDAVEKGELVKVWRHLDEQPNPREGHAAMQFQVADADGLFTNPLTGASADYPGGFGDPEEDANCHCWIEVMPLDEAEKLAAKK